ncbi:MAG: hypothetical protein LBR71_00960 [Synergistaceae bacterium]|jgi:hypothetical protein|nr:hypothetical protein [Synergistaceae bacterium]
MTMAINSKPVQSKEEGMMAVSPTAFAASEGENQPADFIYRAYEQRREKAVGHSAQGIDSQPAPGEHDALPFKKSRERRGAAENMFLHNVSSRFERHLGNHIKIIGLFRSRKSLSKKPDMF